MLDRVGQKNQGIKAWRLAGEGWREALKDNLKEVLATTVGILNTPKSSKLNELYKKAIGMERLSDNWAWHKRTPKQAAEALDALISLRGDIAHRVRLDKPVRKREVLAGSSLVLRLAVLTHNAVGTYLEGRLGKGPPGWGTASYQREKKKTRADEAAAEPAKLADPLLHP